MGEDFPDPKSEIRMTTLHSTRGANYWSDLPITRIDLTLGDYENISSSDVPGFTDSLIEAMPGLRDHRCSLPTNRSSRMNRDSADPCPFCRE